MPESIGFVGVGRMGANMARHLNECGFPIATVFDANQEVAASLAAELKCPTAADLKMVTALSDVIVTVVSDDRAMKQIYIGDCCRVPGESCSSTAPPSLRTFTFGWSRNARPRAPNRWRPAWRRA